jgi:hypothetical protein
MKKEEGRYKNQKPRIVCTALAKLKPNRGYEAL